MTDQRQHITYNPYAMDASPVFSTGEVERLQAICRIPGGSLGNRAVERFSVDLAYASSRLESCSYSHLDSLALIQYGSANPDKPVEDAAMIINHRRAIQYLLGGAIASQESLKAINKRLTDDAMAPASRHFLPAEKQGLARGLSPDGFLIAGTAYMPPQPEDRGLDFVEKEGNRLVANCMALPDPYSQSFYLLTRIPYLQLFYDGNKRTARLACNLPLLANNLFPLSFIATDKGAYLRALLAFYELNDERLAKSLYIKTCLECAFRLMPLSESARQRMATDYDAVIVEAIDFVTTGVAPSDPCWASRRRPAQGDGLDFPGKA